MFHGNFSTWSDAREASSGYDADAVLDRAFDAARAVSLGEGAFERDGVVLDVPEYSFPVLAALLRVAIQVDGPLRVLDIGGAFGTSARQLEAFAPHVAADWRIVEQPAFAERGAKHFTRPDLHFFGTVDAACADGPPHVVLLASTLQYLEQPYAMLDRVRGLGWQALLVDRTPACDAATDRLVVQTVPPSIYDASYPCWIFSIDRLVAALTDARSGARVVATWHEASGPWWHDGGEFRLWGALAMRGGEATGA
jgi:putative methyltransferase (TIGR04325 family)